ncbi:hypothetical protein EZS27_042377, partial [termite gut metagenome]
GVAVFSEIYYPGWEATVDGVPVDIVRANYILRAMNISSGKHTIEMWFKPKSLRMTESIAYGGWGVFVLMVIAGVVRKRK